MTDQDPLPLRNLPADPVDGWIIRCWKPRLDYLQHRGPHLEEHAWQFHVNSTCKDVTGYDGAPYVNTWVVLVNDRVEGRLPKGWESIRPIIQSLYPRRVYVFDAEEARIELVRRAKAERARIETKLNRLNEFLTWSESEWGIL